MRALSTTNENRNLTPENLENEVLSGCKILHKIAIGGMGTIYKARQLSMNRDVAIKVLSDELSKDRAYVQRFILEARAAGELSHTNLIHVIDVGTFHNLYYYVMEYVDGEGLDAVLEKRNFLPPGEGVEIVLQVASALDHAHRKGIIHRDIKPDNIILMPNGMIKLADLGIAKRISAEAEGITQPGMVLGTPFYMAPEQGRDSRLVDARSDIYALGATLYHMLSGQVPFDGKTCLEVVLKAIEAKPTPLLRIKETLPPRVVAICEKMMQKEPDDRYQSTQEVIQDLERVKAGLDPMHAPMPGLGAVRGAIPKSIAAAAAAVQAAADRDEQQSDNEPVEIPETAPIADDGGLFDLNDLGVGDDAVPTAPASSPAPRVSAPAPAAEPRSSITSGRDVPSAAEGEKLFEIDDLAVPETPVERDDSEREARAAARQPSFQDMDPDAPHPAPGGRGGARGGSGGGRPQPGARPAAKSAAKPTEEEDDAAPGPSQLTAAAAHGALNPAVRQARAEESAVRERLIPMITLCAGILAVILGAAWMLRADKPANKGKGGNFGVRNTEPTNGGTPDNGAETGVVLSDTPESRGAIQNADTFAEQHPENLARIIELYGAVITAHPTSKAAQLAKERKAAAETRLAERAKTEFATVEGMRETAQAQHAYGPMIEAIKTFQEQIGDKTWVEKAEQLTKTILAEAQSFFDEAWQQADKFEAAGEYREAINALVTTVELGIPDLVGKATTRMLALSSTIRKQAQEAATRYRDQYILSESVRSNATQRQFKVIEAQLESYLKDPLMRSLRYEIETELEAVRNARKLMEAFGRGIEIQTGKTETIKMAKSVRNGKVVGYEDEKVILDVSGRKTTLALVDILDAELLRFATIALGANKPETHVLIAGYYQTMGNTDEAGRQIEAAEALKGDVRLARESLEEHLLQVRLLTSSTEVDIGESGYGRWNIPSAMKVEYNPFVMTSTTGKDAAVLGEAPWVDYVWTIRARKLKGLNGFQVQFKAANRYYIWALGEEQNTYSWVRGFPDTKAPEKVSSGRWYDIKVVVTGRRVAGYLDGVRKWQILVPENEIPENAKAMGLGYAHTSVVFSDLRLWELK